MTIEPGRYRAVATDGSGETITIVIVGSSIDASSLSGRATIRGLSEAFHSDGRRMTPTDEEDTFKIVGEQRGYKIVQPT